MASLLLADAIKPERAGLFGVDALLLVGAALELATGTGPGNEPPGAASPTAYQPLGVVVAFPSGAGIGVDAGGAAGGSRSPDSVNAST